MLCQNDFAFIKSAVASSSKLQLLKGNSLCLVFWDHDFRLIWQIFIVAIVQVKSMLISLYLTHCGCYRLSGLVVMILEKLYFGILFKLGLHVMIRDLYPSYWKCTDRKSNKHKMHWGTYTYKCKGSWFFFFFYRKNYFFVLEISRTKCSAF